MSQQPHHLPLAMWRSVHEHDLLHAGDRCLIACSGGPDSVALAHLIADSRFRIRDATDIPAANLALVHVNHHAHDRADEMAAHVQALAAQLGIDYITLDVDLPDAMQPGDSVEHVARQLRYAAITEAARDWHATAVLLAHNRDDQEETILMALLEGRGLFHLGMPRVRAMDTRMRLVRPLLDVPRAEIEALAMQHDLKALSDPTNTEVQRTRNRLRHEVLPMLEQAGFAAVRQHLRELAGDTREWAGAVERDAVNALARAIDRSHADDPAALLRVQTHELEALALPVRLAAWAELLRLVGRSPRDVSRALLVDIDGALDLAPGRGIDIGGGLRLLRIDAYTFDFRGDAASPALPPAPPPLHSTLQVPGVTRLASSAGALDLHASIELIDAAGLDALRDRRDGHVAAVQPISLAEGMWVRGRQSGDRFRPLGAPGSRLLKRVLQSRQVPADWRRECPVVVDAAGRIVWVVGVEIAHDARVVDCTKPVLMLRAVPAGSSQ